MQNTFIKTYKFSLNFFTLFHIYSYKYLFTYKKIPKTCALWGILLIKYFKRYTLTLIFSSIFLYYISYPPSPPFIFIHPYNDKSLSFI